MAYSVDFREKVVQYVDAGHQQREAAGAFGISLSTVNKWHQQFEKTGDLSDKPRRTSFKKIDPIKLEEYVTKHPDAYLKEIAVVFDCSATAVKKALVRLGYTRKKNLSLPRAKPGESSTISVTDRTDPS